jgi:uncharacterized membrane protein
MSATETVPSSREFTLLGVTYGIYVTGLFLFWPLLVGIAIAYVKRRDVEDTILESHYGWLIRTFWWWTVLWVAIIAAMAAVIVPDALVVAQAARTGDYLGIPWSIIGAAVLGGIALATVWFWAAYRLLRGTLRLSDGRAVP